MAIELMNKQETCWRCGGAGRINRGVDRCPGCSGTGQQARLRPVQLSCGVIHLDHEGNEILCPSIYPRADQPCPSCGGSGYRMVTVETQDGRLETRTDPCTGCGGSGRVA